MSGGERTMMLVGPERIALDDRDVVGDRHAAELGLEPEALAHDGESLTDHARAPMGRRTGSKVSR